MVDLETFQRVTNMLLDILLFGFIGITVLFGVITGILGYQLNKLEKKVDKLETEHEIEQRVKQHQS